MNEYKIVLLGNQSVGKTKILDRFCNDCYKDEGNATVGAAFASKEIHILGQQIKLMIWDTAGQEVFRAMNKIYYQQAQVAVLVYDVSKKETWKGLQRWYDDLKDNCDVQAMVIIVAANKSDLKKVEDGRKFCQENSLHYFEVSAKTGDGIQGNRLIKKEMFDFVAMRISQLRKENPDFFFGSRKTASLSIQLKTAQVKKKRNWFKEHC